MTGRADGPRDAIGAMLGAGEDERLARLLAEKLEQQRRLLLGLRPVQHLPDAGNGPRDHAGVHANRTDEMLPHQRRDPDDKSVADRYRPSWSAPTNARWRPATATCTGWS